MQVSAEILAQEVHIVIQLSDAVRDYHTHDVTVRGFGPVSLKIPAGQAVGVVGSSGAGKSTLLSTIGLLDSPTSGVYRLDGIDVSGLSEKHRSVIRRDRIGFVFQRYNLLDELTVSQNVELPLIYQGCSSSRRREAARLALDRVGLSGKGGLRAWQLSGGEQQRVAIARAVVGKPQIILCDEPTGNLDSSTGELVVKLLLDIHRESPNRILVVVTHNVSIARQLDRVLIMRDGRVMQDGVPQEVLAQ